MVCPACIGAVVISQLPAVSAAALSVAGIKLAYDQKHSPNAQSMKGAQPVRAIKVDARPLGPKNSGFAPLACRFRLRVRSEASDVEPLHVWMNHGILCRRPGGRN